MKVRIPLLGKTRSAYLDAGIRDYSRRLARFVPVELPVLREQRHGRKEDGALKSAEAALLLEQAVGTHAVVLDPGGEAVDSEGLARLVRAWTDRGVGTLCFLIGGHLGLDRSVLDRADHILALSRLTFTHEMTRLILLEQLYRAWTINAGHSYHK
ncbi:MAG: 23S rRNA (pseudouridine(1915)-N(3))-methyltransferase RlmH [Desulfobulbus sp.]|jgi:23S rRNA (pseudouridine1915-N3)-methyltransferase